MAEGRMIKKEIKKSKKLANIKNDKARVLYFMLYPHADVEGRLSADPIDIMAECIPLFKWKGEIICKALNDLHAIGLIVLYKVNERIYLQITRFHDFQRIDRGREAGSKIPAPNSNELQIAPDNSSEHAISKVKLSISLSKVKLIKNKGDFFNYFLLKTNKKLKLTSERERIIVQRLQTHSLEDLKRAVDNFIQDDWPDRGNYIDIVYCIGVRNRVDNLEKWLNWKPKSKLTASQEYTKGKIKEFTTK